MERTKKGEFGTLHLLQLVLLTHKKKVKQLSVTPGKVEYHPYVGNF